MDPVTVLACVNGSLGILLKLGKIIKFLVVISRQFKFADAKIVLLIGYLSSLKGTLEQLKIVLKRFEEKDHAQELIDLTQTTLDCTQLSLSYLETQLDPLAEAHEQGLNVLDKLKLLIKKDDFESHLGGIDKFVNALNLLLNAIQCQTIVEQQSVVETAESRAIFRALQDETTSIIGLKDRNSIVSERSSLSGAPNDLDVSFAFDAEVLDSRIYAVAYRSHLKRVMTTKQTQFDSSKGQLTSTVSTSSGNLRSPQPIGDFTSTDGVTMVLNGPTGHSTATRERENADTVIRVCVLGLPNSGKKTLIRAAALADAEPFDRQRLDRCRPVILDAMFNAIARALINMKASGISLDVAWEAPYAKLLSTPSNAEQRAASWQHYRNAVLRLQSDKAFRNALWVHPTLAYANLEHYINRFRPISNQSEPLTIMDVLLCPEIAGFPSRYRSRTYFDPSRSSEPKRRIELSCQANESTLPNQWESNLRSCDMILYLVDISDIRLSLNAPYANGVFDVVEKSYLDLKRLVQQNPSFASKTMLIYTKCDLVLKRVTRGVDLLDKDPKATLVKVIKGLDSKWTDMLENDMLHGRFWSLDGFLTEVDWGSIVHCIWSKKIWTEAQHTVGAHGYSMSSNKILDGLWLMKELDDESWLPEDLLHHKVSESQSSRPGPSKGTYSLN